MSRKRRIRKNKPEKYCGGHVTVRIVTRKNRSEYRDPISLGRLVAVGEWIPKRKEA